MGGFSLEDESVGETSVRWLLGFFMNFYLTKLLIIIITLLLALDVRCYMMEVLGNMDAPLENRCILMPSQLCLQHVFLCQLIHYGLLKLLYHYIELLVVGSSVNNIIGCKRRLLDDRNINPYGR